MKTPWIVFLIAIPLTNIWAQEVEIGFRGNWDILYMREFNRTTESGYQSVYGHDPFVLHAVFTLRVHQYVIPELRAGYAAVGPYDGWELGLVVKSELVQDVVYAMVFDWLHWNNGGYGGTTTSTYERLFNAPGIGLGVYTGVHSSIEVKFQKPFGGDLGYTLIFGSTPPEKKPTSLLWVIRLGFGFSWRL